MHRPGLFENKGDVVFQPDKSNRKVVDVEMVRIRPVFGVFPEIIGCHGRNGQWFRITDGMQAFIDGIAAQVAQAAESALVGINKGSCRDAAPSAERTQSTRVRTV